MAARRLAKLAAAARRLDSKMQKEAVVGAVAGLLGRAALSAGKLAIRNPGTALTVGLGGAASAGSYRQHKAGFDPKVQKAMLGDIPVPPGAQ